VRTRRLQASVNLVRALGGGWRSAKMKDPPHGDAVATAQ